MNAALGPHSQRFALSKHAHRSYDKIAFLPNTNSSEYLTFFLHFTLFTLVVNENEKNNRKIKIKLQIVQNKIADLSHSKKFANIAKNVDY